VYDRDHAIGLGYRVPLVIASPWSRGGCINSQVFDHTSILMFLENWLNGKGKWVKETNISGWRRAVCGDLTSVFREYSGEAIDLPRRLDLGATVERIYAAQFQPPPSGGNALTRDAVAAKHVAGLQETGTRPSCPLPYELVVNGVTRDGALTLSMEARVDAFGRASQGAPFNAYSYGDSMICRSYAVRAGDTFYDALPAAGAYHVRVDGPNGFRREFRGDAKAHADVRVDYARRRAADGVLEIVLANPTSSPREITIRDEAYGAPLRRVAVQANERSTIAVDTAGTHGWYDFSVNDGSQTFRYAGRVETGKWSISDPA
jgi:phospholipase C